MAPITQIIPSTASYETLTTSQQAALDALGLDYGPNNPRNVRSAAFSCYSHRLLMCAADALIAMGQAHNAMVVHKRIRAL